MAKDGLAQLAKLRQVLPQVALQAMQYTATWMEAQAKQTTVFIDRTGNLRNSIQAGTELQGATVTGALAAGMPGIGATMTYAPFIELGTKPHVIVPRTAKALFWPGAAHPVQRVNHPGTAPRPFIKPAVELAVAQNILPRAFDGLLKRAMG